MHFSNKKFMFALALGSFIALSQNVYASRTDDSWILNRQGMYKISQGNVEGAIDDFEKACRLDPFNDTALANLACARNNLGVSYAKKQNFAEAIRQFKNAKDQKPEDISIRLNLLSTLVTIKNTNDTETEIKELLKLRPNDSDIAIKAATAYQKIENTVAAISTLQEFTERNPGDAKVNATLARLLYLNGNLAESKYYITRSLELAPEDQKNLEFLTKLDKEACVEATTNSFSGKHFELACPDSFSEEWVRVSPFTYFALPIAATTMSAVFTSSGRFCVLEWAIVTVAFSFISSAPIGFPTIFERPITTALFPLIEML